MGKGVRMKNIPYSEVAERGLLGSILIDPEKIHDLQIKAEEFYIRKHQTLWSTLIDMSGSNQHMDTITIGEWLNNHGELDNIGGYDYMSKLMEGAGVSHHSQSYADEIVRHSKSRQLIGILDGGCEKAYNDDPESVSSEVMSSLIDGMSSRSSDLEVHEHAEKYIDNCNEGVAGTFSWFTPEWDFKLGRMSSELMILHAPRSTGKTAMMLQWIVEAHRAEKRTPLASIEMLKSELAPRFIGHIGNINTLTMRIRKPTVEEESKAREATKKIKALNLCVRDKGMSIDDIRSFAIKESRKGVDAIFIDNLLSISDGGKQYQSKTIMYDDFIRKLRDLRDTLEIPIIILAHPNAEGQVAWSRDVENFADVILFMAEVPSDGLMVSGKHIAARSVIGKHIIAKWQKNRQGIQPIAHLDFIGETQTFRHLDWE